MRRANSLNAAVPSQKLTTSPETLGCDQSVILTLYEIGFVNKPNSSASVRRFAFNEPTKSIPSASDYSPTGDGIRCCEIIVWLGSTPSLRE